MSDSKEPGPGDVPTCLHRVPLDTACEKCERVALADPAGAPIREYIMARQAAGSAEPLRERLLVAAFRGPLALEMLDQIANIDQAAQQLVAYVDAVIADLQGPPS